MKFCYAILLGTSLCAPAALSADKLGDCSGDDCAVLAAADQYEYKILDMPLQQVFSTLQSETGQRIVVAPEVTGRVSQLDLSGSAEDMIATVAQQNNLDWFSYDGAFYVSRAADAVTRLIPLAGMSSEIAQESLNGSGLKSSTARINPVADGKALSISGPSEYLALAEAILAVTEAPEEPERSVVRVRRGVTTTLEYYGEAGMIAANQTAPSENTAPIQEQAVEPPAQVEQQQEGVAADG